MLRAVHHIGITVADLDQALAFYEEVLGFERQMNPTPWADAPAISEAIGVPGAVFRVAYLNVGGVLLEFVQYQSPPSPIDEPVPSNAIGSQHFAFRTDDISAAVERLRAAGVDFFSEINVVEDGPLAGWSWIYFADPEGNSIELVEIAGDRERTRL